MHTGQQHQYSGSSHKHNISNNSNNHSTGSTNTITNNANIREFSRSLCKSPPSQTTGAGVGVAGGVSQSQSQQQSQIQSHPSDFLSNLKRSSHSPTSTPIDPRLHGTHPGVKGQVGRIFAESHGSQGSRENYSHLDEMTRNKIDILLNEYEVCVCEMCECMWYM